MSTTQASKPISVSAADPEVRGLAGMHPLHAARLAAFAQGAYRACNGRKYLIIVRGSDPLSLPHQGRPNHHPKPVTVKAKVGETGRGRRKVDGRQYISDYDLQGVYERRHDGGYMRVFISNLKKDRDDAGDPRPWVGAFDPAQNVFLRALNEVVCPGLGLFQHGANDDYLKGGEMLLAPDEDAVFLAFEPDGGILFLPDRAALKAFYASRGINWAYRV